MSLATITETDIRNWVGGQSFSRGQGYYGRNAISGPWRQDQLLKAKCWGSMPAPYHVWVLLGAHGIQAAGCSCPVGDGGHCKHAAALLLTWLHEPDSFQAHEPLEEALAQREKADLALLIRQMIARYPDLEELVYLVPAGAAAPAGPADAGLIRRQVKSAIAHGGYGDDYYGAAATIAGEVETIMSQGDVYREQDDWQNAALVYSAVVRELLDQYTEVYDHDGELSSLFYAGGERLGECLEYVQDAATRLEILHTLVDIVNEDIRVGGYGFGDAAYEVVLEQATPAEKSQMVEWVEAELAGASPADQFSGKWRQQSYGRFLLALQAETLTDEQFIQLCRQAALTSQVVDRLLALSRLDEAVAEAQAAADYDLLSLANVLVAHGHGATAEGLVWERLARSKDRRLDGWLKEYAVKNEEWPKAIIYAENLFWQNPDTGSYQEIQSLAEKLGDWPARREKILQRLAQENRHDLLTRIHLLEGDVALALAALDRLHTMRTPGWAYSDSLSIEVAQAAEASYPREAIRLYRRQVERLIAGRGRGNYVTAAEYLKQVRSLYQRLNETAAWNNYIADLRLQNPRLRALQEELKRAGL
ncbi:MAG: hypothetical protein L0322_15425 [Chloroflexi bacterium]|nr:hypothetical protein [Chloroflexota bacterium]MCI0649031.1 hypothetical protein [Chloroflexota bacterium]